MVVWLSDERTKWVKDFLECISAVYVVGLGLFGIRILLVLSFADFSSFIVPDVGCLFTWLHLTFARLFVSMSRTSSVWCGTANIITGLRNILTGFVTVGFVFLLSELFFWNFKNVPSSRIWWVLPRRLIVRCMMMVWCRRCSTVQCLLKSLGWVLHTPDVLHSAFQPFLVLHPSLSSATVSAAVMVSPCPAVPISFLGAAVFTLMSVVMCLCVLCVLITLLMICEGVVSLRRIVRGLWWRWLSKSAVYIHLR